MEWKKLILSGVITFILVFLLFILTPFTRLFDWVLKWDTLTFLLFIFTEIVFGIFLYVVAVKYIKIKIQNTFYLVLNIFIIWIIVSIPFLLLYLFIPNIVSDSSCEYPQADEPGTIRNPDHPAPGLCAQVRDLIIKIILFGPLNPITLIIGSYIAKKYFDRQNPRPKTQNRKQKTGN